jgi:hypothetical protein
MRWGKISRGHRTNDPSYKLSQLSANNDPRKEQPSIALPRDVFCLWPQSLPHSLPRSSRERGRRTFSGTASSLFFAPRGSNRGKIPIDRGLANPSTNMINPEADNTYNCFKPDRIAYKKKSLIVPAGQARHVVELPSPAREARLGAGKER